MSATAVLVPVLESEAEALLAGGEPRAGARRELVHRTRKLRARVARVDSIREELHALLFPRWASAHRQREGFFTSLFAYFQKPEPAQPSRGYDPFVHLFGRSLPVVAGDSRAFAERLAALEAMDEEAFTRALGEDLGSLEPRARTLWEEAVAPDFSLEIERLVGRELAFLDEALARRPLELQKPYDSLVRLSAWSHPVWRFDGELLPGLLSTIGVELELFRPVELFEEYAEEQGLSGALQTLPRQLGSFDGAGTWLSSSQVKLLAGALRLQRRRIATNASAQRQPELVMRHVRLLEEAVFYCESQGYGLSEAAGLEWHERPR